MKIRLMGTLKLISGAGGVTNNEQPLRTIVCCNALTKEMPIFVIVYLSFLFQRNAPIESTVLPCFNILMFNTRGL